MYSTIPTRREKRIMAVGWTIEKDYGDGSPRREGKTYVYFLPPDEKSAERIPYILTGDDYDPHYAGRVHPLALESLIDWASHDTGATMLFLPVIEGGSVGRFTMANDETRMLFHPEGEWGMVIG